MTDQPFGDTLEMGSGEVSALIGEQLFERINGFIAELRVAGLPVTLTEALDAFAAVRHVPLEDRSMLRAALGATLVKSEAHMRSFETIFDVYFSLSGAGMDADDDVELLEDDEVPHEHEGERTGDDIGRDLTDDELREMLRKALLDANSSLVRALARHAVTRFAGMEPGRPVGGTYYLYRTLRRLEIDAMSEELMGRMAQGAQAPTSALEQRLAADDIEARIGELKAEIEAEIRRRLVADRGAEAMAKTLRKPLPEDVEFMHASREEMAMLRKAIYPLTRKLAARLARKRRHGRRGPLDFRSTMRHSLSYGGVPVEPKYRQPRPSKPEIFVIADVSGSVAAFARFTLHLVHAISSQFSKVRSFVFIDGIDEATRFFEGADDIADAVYRVNTEADVVWMDGHSDYGHAFEAFWRRWGREIGPRTTVMILGDARNNYHQTQAWVVAEIQRRARHVYWLNPEPRAYWNTGDSILGEYAPYLDGTFECRNLRQLERFVDNLA